VGRRLMPRLWAPRMRRLARPHGVRRAARGPRDPGTAARCVATGDCGAGKGAAGASGWRVAAAASCACACVGPWQDVTRGRYGYGCGAWGQVMAEQSYREVTRHASPGFANSALLTLPVRLHLAECAAVARLVRRPPPGPVRRATHQAPSGAPP
jgi:hypothetical protein